MHGSSPCDLGERKTLCSKIIVFGEDRFFFLILCTHRTSVAVNACLMSSAVHRLARCSSELHCPVRRPAVGLGNRVLMLRTDPGPVTVNSMSCEGDTFGCCWLVA